MKAGSTDKATTVRRYGLRILGMAAVPLSIYGSPAFSNEQDISDHGISGFPNNAHYCQIVILQNGVLGASYDARNLGSREAGGQPGRVEIAATNSSFRLIVENPNSFKVTPSGYFGDVRFNAGISGRGDTNFGETEAGQPVKIKRGKTLIFANVSATKLDGSFPAGSYQVGSTLRCE